MSLPASAYYQREGQLLEAARAKCPRGNALLAALDERIECLADTNPRRIYLEALAWEVARRNDMGQEITAGEDALIRGEMAR